jgi:glutathione synthase/RimK-type ligase-like ATP-grasp enzyme
MYNKPLIVFVFSLEGSSTSTRYGGFARRLQKAGGLKNSDVLTVALENLLFTVKEDGSADVIDMVSGRSMSDAALVYMKGKWGLPEEASALANYLLHRGVPFMDTSALGSVMSKIATTMRLWGHGVAVPFTLYVRRHDRMAEALLSYKSELGERFILKDAQGAKGKLNFFVTYAEALAVLEQNPDVQFVAQRFIENDGDYRVGVYVGKSAFAIARKGSGDTHLNNTSAGGTATYLPVNELPAKYRSLAEKASRAVDLQVSGVDIIIDRITGKPYILEVNQGSQIVTGAYTAENMMAFSNALEGAVRGRYARKRAQPTRMIGRRSIAKLPELGATKIVAKIDTGAYSSTLHAENIHTAVNDDGERVLRFDVVPSAQLVTKDTKQQTIETKDYFVQKVRSSNGVTQERFSIKTRMTLEGRVFPAVLTLSDRSEMGYPLLIGRRLIRSRFIVNVELNEDNNSEWNY